MPDLDGFELAAMVREHPRFQQTAIIFVSAIHLTDIDRLKGYEMGAVDYVPVPVVPEVLRAKVRVFAELYRKTRQLEQLNADLERRVAERTAELEASNRSLRESERRRSLALAAGQMGSWDWDVVTGQWVWDAGQYRIFGVVPAPSGISIEDVRSIIDPDDMARLEAAVAQGMPDAGTFQMEIRARRPDGQIRWCICAAAMTADQADHITHVSGVTLDITDLKEAEARRELLAREVDHRVGNAERFAISGPQVFLTPATAQAIAIVVHELATNAAKYGALSQGKGKVTLAWEWHRGVLRLLWQESGGTLVRPAETDGYGSKVIAASARQLAGTTRFDWQPTGLRFAMIMRIGDPSGNGQQAPAGLEDVDDFEASARASELPAGGQILLVEDEAFVAMMMRDLIAEIGFHVVGPFGKIADAIENLDRYVLVAAVLDVNLAGEKIYPLAEQLSGRGIPFVFVTGYAADAIDDRFASVPVLQKPV